MKTIFNYLLGIIGFAAIVFTLWNLPHTLTDMAMEQNQGWEVNAKKSAEQLAAGRPYCIIAPKSNQGRYVFNNFSEINIRPIIHEEVSAKLRHFEYKFGRESQSMRRPRSHHFNILIDNELYYWSFTQQQFYLSEQHPYDHHLYQDMKRRKQKYVNNINSETTVTARQKEQQRLLRHYGKINPDVTIEDFICPHILAEKY